MIRNNFTIHIRRTGTIESKDLSGSSHLVNSRVRDRNIVHYDRHFIAVIVSGCMGIIGNREGYFICSGIAIYM